MQIPIGTLCSSSPSTPPKHMPTPNAARWFFIVPPFSDPRPGPRRAFAYALWSSRSVAPIAHSAWPSRVLTDPLPLPASRAHRGGGAIEACTVGAVRLLFATPTPPSLPRTQPSRASRAGGSRTISPQHDDLAVRSATSRDNPEKQYARAA